MTVDLQIDFQKTYATQTRPGVANANLDPIVSVAHIAPLYGGAAIAARRLHIGLRNAGVNSTLYVTLPLTDELKRDYVQAMPAPNRLLHYVDQSSKIVSRRVGLTGMIHVSSLFWSFPGFDIVHLHGADSNWFNLHALYRLSRHHALVWTMHDKQLGTGGSGYPERFGGCERWLAGCGQCPKVKAQGWWFDFSHFIQARKRAIVRSTGMTIVAPSQWMFDFISRSPVTKTQTLALIPNGVDINSFIPLSRQQSRSELGLPAAGKCLLAVATNLADPRKGWQFFEPLLRSLKSVYSDDVALVLIGDPPPVENIEKLRTILPVHVLGRINSVERLAMAYSAADLFIIPSVIDNFPSVILESLACGTPVAGFRVGGIPDMVIPGKTGVLTELGDTAALALEIRDLLNDDNKLLYMRTQSRSQVIQNFSTEIQAEKHLELYDKMIGASHNKNNPTALN